MRKHIKEQEEAGTLMQKKEKKRKTGGLMDRLSKALEERQRQMSGQRGSQTPSRRDPRRKKRR